MEASVDSRRFCNCALCQLPKCLSFAALQQALFIDIKFIKFVIIFLIVCVCNLTPSNRIIQNNYSITTQLPVVYLFSMFAMFKFRNNKKFRQSVSQSNVLPHPSPFLKHDKFSFQGPKAIDLSAQIIGNVNKKENRQKQFLHNLFCRLLLDWLHIMHM